MFLDQRDYQETSNLKKTYLEDYGIIYNLFNKELENRGLQPLTDFYVYQYTQDYVTRYNPNFRGLKYFYFRIGKKNALRYQIIGDHTCCGKCHIGALSNVNIRTLISGDNGINNEFKTSKHLTMLHFIMTLLIKVEFSPVSCINYTVPDRDFTNAMEMHKILLKVFPHSVAEYRNVNTNRIIYDTSIIIYELSKLIKAVKSDLNTHRATLKDFLNMIDKKTHIPMTDLNIKHLTENIKTIIDTVMSIPR